jgi:hypothetical protein
MPARTIAAFDLGGGTGKEGGSRMAAVECAEGRYETHNGEFGKSYRWCPECLLVKCDCGETTTLDHSDTTCVWYGTDHTSIIQEELVPQWLEDEAVDSWRYSGAREEAGGFASASRP